MLRSIPNPFKFHTATALVVVTGISIGTIVQDEVLIYPVPYFRLLKKVRSPL